MHVQMHEKSRMMRKPKANHLTQTVNVLNKQSTWIFSISQKPPHSKNLSGKSTLYNKDYRSVGNAMFNLVMVSKRKLEKLVRR
jgi:hypothetical protein